MKHYGYSLLSVLVVLSVLSLTLVEILRLFDMGSGFHKHMASIIELGNTMNQLSLFLNNPAVCKRYFEGKKINLDSSILSQQVIPNTVSPEPLVISFPSDATRVFLHAGKKVQGLFTIMQVSVREFEENGEDRYAAQLVVEVKQSNNLVVFRKIPVGLKTKANSMTEREIVECLPVVRVGSGSRYLQSVYVQNNTLMTTTQVLGPHDAIPQITQGLEFLSATITPTNSNSILRIRIQASMDSSGPSRAAHMALFRIGNTNALSTIQLAFHTTGYVEMGVIEFETIAGVITPVTFTARIGSPAAGETVSVNGRTDIGTMFGGTVYSTMVVEELSR